ncbi:MAG: glutamine amidotransferase [Planctomycetaceae bacterium]
MEFIVDPVWPWSIVALVGVGLVAVVLLTYPPRVRHLAPWRRRLLIGLRLLTALLLVFAMFRPALRFTETDTQSAELVILLDKSASMATPDGPGGITRRELVLKTLADAEPMLKELTEKVDLRLIDFSEQPAAVETPDETADGDFTAIGSILDELRREDSGNRLLGVVLMSDGAQRAVAPNDIDPRTAARRFAEQLGVPIHTVSFGTSDLSTAGLDLSVDEMLMDTITFEKKTVPVRVQARLLGAAGRPVKIQLLKEERRGKRLGESGDLKVIPFPQAGKEYTARSNDETIAFDLELVAEEPGEFKIAAEVVPLEGELKTTNNRLETLLTVRKGGLKVAYFDVLGRNESRFIMELNETANIQLDWQVLLPGPFASRTEISPKWFEPGEYDVFIIGDVPASAFRKGNTDLLEKLADRLEDGAGLMMIGGQHSFGAGGYADTRLADFLPVVMRTDEHIPDDAIDNDQQLVRRLPMLPTRAGVALHYVMNIDPRDNSGTWAKMSTEAPLLGANRITPKESATVLAESTDHIPLLAVTDAGAARSIALATDSTWTWHMHGFREEHQRFWQQMVLWLARKELEGDQPVWVLVDPRNFAPQSNVAISFGARDEARRPISDAEFTVTLTKPDGEVRELTPGRDGDNGLSVFEETDLPGDYWVTVTATHIGKAVGQPATTRFIVDPRDIERDNPAADPDLMAEIASLTGTLPMTAELFPSFIENLLESGLTTELTQHTQVNLWDSWPLRLVFVLMMSTEWFVRKRRGLV